MRSRFPPIDIKTITTYTSAVSKALALKQLKLFNCCIFCIIPVLYTVFLETNFCKLKIFRV